MSRPRLKKRLGQHHLKDGALCRPLLDFLRLGGQRVLEIGPGGGVLTAELLTAGARVVACDLDLEWAFELRRRHPSLHLAAVDVLDLDLARLPPPTLVTGNLPFNVATPIIEALLPRHKNVPRAAFMVQKEVAERLVARPGEKAYGSLSVLVEAWAEARYLGTVKPGSFTPPPKVAAGFVGLELRPPPLAETAMLEFVRFVRMAFAQRRKTLKNVLSAGLGRETASAILAAVGRDGRERAETLGLAEFLELFRASEAHPAAASARPIDSS